MDAKLPWDSCVWTTADAAPTSDQRHFFDMLHPEDNLSLFGFSDCAPEDGKQQVNPDSLESSQMPTAKRPYEDTDDAWDRDQSNKIAASGSKVDVAAARAKANREKQRREKLNGRCALHHRKMNMAYSSSIERGW